VQTARANARVCGCVLRPLCRFALPNKNCVLVVAKSRVWPDTYVGAGHARRFVRFAGYQGREPFPGLYLADNRESEVQRHRALDLPHWRVVQQAGNDARGGRPDTGTWSCKLRMIQRIEELKHFRDFGVQAGRIPIGATISRLGRSEPPALWAFAVAPVRRLPWREHCKMALLCIFASGVSHSGVAAAR
jgi:hypothetical protein